MFSEKRQYGQDPEKVVRSKTKFYDPLKWREPARVFTCSWSDWFIAEADAWRPEAWEIVRKTPHLTYQILTKRPSRIASHLPEGWPLPNVHLGVSVESRKYLHRIDVLRGIAAAVRFVSFEPLLEDLGAMDLSGIAWAIFGGESGSSARPLDLAWIRSGVRECRWQSVRTFVKQAGARVVDSERMTGRYAPQDKRAIAAAVALDCADNPPNLVLLRDRKGGDPGEWGPGDWPREFPA